MISSTGPLLRGLLDAEQTHTLGLAAARYGLFPKETRPDPTALAVHLWNKHFPNPIGA